MIAPRIQITDLTGHSGFLMSDCIERVQDSEGETIVFTKTANTHIIATTAAELDEAMTVADQEVARLNPEMTDDIRAMANAWRTIRKCLNGTAIALSPGQDGPTFEAARDLLTLLGEKWNPLRPSPIDQSVG